jgi:hypothetical protein
LILHQVAEKLDLGRSEVEGKTQSARTEEVWMDKALFFKKGEATLGVQEAH